MRGQMTLPAFRELPPETRAAQRARVLAAVQARSRRRALVVVAVGLAVLTAAPAFALQRELVDFFSAEPAPERIQLDFAFLREHTAETSAKFGGPSYTPEGTAREVLTVMLDGERRPLSVAPTQEGGFCYRLHFYGSCRSPADPWSKISAGGLSNAEGVQGSAWIVGSVVAPEVQEVVLVYQDGERARLPFVWVSPPVNAGFFAYEVPDEHRVPGHVTAALLGLDRDRNEVARHCLPLSPDAAEASVPEVRELCPPRRRPPDAGAGEATTP
jgi:hypothetical protein